MYICVYIYIYRIRAGRSKPGLAAQHAVLPQTLNPEP